MLDGNWMMMQVAMQKSFKVREIRTNVRVEKRCSGKDWQADGPQQAE